MTVCEKHEYCIVVWHMRDWEDRYKECPICEMDKKIEDLESKIETLTEERDEAASNLEDVRKLADGFEDEIEKLKAERTRL